MTTRLLRLLLTIALIVVAFGTAVGFGLFLLALAKGESLQTTLTFALDGARAYPVVLRGTGTVAGNMTADHATLSVTAGGIGYLLGQGFDILLSGGLWLVILLALRRLVRRISAGRPFDDAGIGRLRVIGWSMIALNIWMWVRVTLLPLALLPDIEVAGGSWALLPAVSQRIPGMHAARVDAQLEPTLLIAGLLMLVLAEAFRIGRTLREDSEAIV